MNPERNDTRHAYLVSIWRYAISFLVGIIVAAFTVGSARQRMKDVATWKDEVAPRIERMDARGTLSFEHFHQEYLRTQARQEEKLKQLEQQVRELERHP